MSTLTTIQSTDLITNSRAVINDNFSALNTDKMETSVLDTDTTLAANSDLKVPSQKAVKAYVDAGGNVNASTTAKGIVELATAAEIDAGTATGATGAALVVTAEALKGSLAPIVRTYLNAGSPHTWTKPAGLKYVVVEVQAGGGGGGGATDVAGNRGSGGGGGGYSKKIISASSLGATETVTIGAGGTAGVTSGTGGTGGTSSFGTHASATGGTGGTGNNGASGGGGVGSSGDLNLYGDYGMVSTDTDSHRGDGGHSFLGGTVQGKTTNSQDHGTTGRLYGGGGGGGGRNSNGGAGGAGVVIVTEHYV